jgi:hypothetical protein
LFIPDPDPDFLPIPDPGSSGQKGSGSRIPDQQHWTSQYFTKDKTKENAAPSYQYDGHNSFVSVREVEKKAKTVQSNFIFKLIYVSEKTVLWILSRSDPELFGLLRVDLFLLGYILIFL